jgi:hypothetical protein
MGQTPVSSTLSGENDSNVIQSRRGGRSVKSELRMPGQAPNPSFCALEAGSDEGRDDLVVLPAELESDDVPEAAGLNPLAVHLEVDRAGAPEL